MSVDAPVVAVIFGGVFVPQGDVVDCLVDLGCSKKLAAIARLQNWEWHVQSHEFADSGWRGR
jgi:hypothetical protein